MNPPPEPAPNPKTPDFVGESILHPKPKLPEFGPYLTKYGTIARALKAYLEPFYRAIPAFVQGPTPEADKARFERVFRPWPKWVFRLGAELWRVDYPTIDRSIFFQTIRTIHVILFRCPTDPNAIRFSSTRKDAFERLDIRVLPLVMASFWGHSAEHLWAARKKLDEQLASGKITREEYEKSSVLSSLGVLDAAVRDMFGKLTDEEVSALELTRAIEDARDKTFDKDGGPKETPLIPIYREILHNWVAIEKMSGPKELTEYLSPNLGNQDFEDKYNRVKSICNRMGIKFRPSVKVR